MRAEPASDARGEPAAAPRPDFATRWLAGAVAALLRALGATWRVRGEGPDPFPAGEPFVGALWHRGFLVAAWLWRGRGLAVAVSRSRDGARIDAVLARLGYASSPRGSSSRGGRALLREARRLLLGGTSVAILPDGPRGPAREAKPGALAIARLGDAGVVPVGIAARPCLRFGSWDRSILPLPFARVHYRYGEPLPVPKKAGDGELEALRRRLESDLDALDAASARALGLPAETSEGTT